MSANISTVIYFLSRAAKEALSIKTAESAFDTIEDARAFIPKDAGFLQDMASAIMVAATATLHTGAKQPMRPTEEQGCVYLVEREDGAIKIGVTSNPERRKQQLICQGAVLSTMRFMDGGRAKEASLHRRFKESRIHGEWFRPDDEIVKFKRHLDAQTPTTGQNI